MSTSIINTPDDVESYKHKLAQQVLNDIGNLAKTYIDDSNGELEHLLVEVKNKLRTTDKALSSEIVGPELYRWLAHTAWCAEHEHQDELYESLTRIPNLLIGRIVTAPSHKKSIEVALPNFSHCDLRIPQASAHLDKTDLAWLQLTIDENEISHNGHIICALRDIQKQIDGKSNANTLKLKGTPIFFHQSGDDLHDMIAELSQTASIPVNRDETLTLYTEEELTEDHDAKCIIENMSKGYQLIEQYDPEHAKEICSVMDAITLAKGGRFVGGSDIWYHGVAVLNPDVEWSPITYADHLIHESAHIFLHTINELNPVLCNAAFMGAPSPIRKDPRPLCGILHSTYVFMRLSGFFHKLSFVLKTDEALFRLHRHLLGFYEGIETVKKYAEWTHEGRQFFDKMIETEQYYRDQLPSPDPKYYNRVGKDYVV